MATKPKDKPTKLSETDQLRRENLELKRELVQRSLNDFAREHDAFYAELAKKYDFVLGTDQIAADGAIVRQPKKEEK